VTREDVIAGIRKVWEFSKALSVDELFSNPTPLVPSQAFVDTATDRYSSYESLYLCGLQNGDYNIQLVDFSYFQFGFSKQDHVRFAYYPNPFLGSSAEVVAEVNDLRAYVEEGLVTIEEFLHRIAEIRNSQHAPLLRYENAPDEYLEFLHPCSHFHFGHHTENRWQIQRILSPLGFALIAFQQFHSGNWQSASSVTAFGKTESPRTFLAAEKYNCRVLPEELFSAEEKGLFSFV
jgi:hypothetical protein